MQTKRILVIISAIILTSCTPDLHGKIIQRQCNYKICDEPEFKEHRFEYSYEIWRKLSKEYSDIGIYEDFMTDSIENLGIENIYEIAKKDFKLEESKEAFTNIITEHIRVLKKYKDLREEKCECSIIENTSKNQAYEFTIQILSINPDIETPLKYSSKKIQLSPGDFFELGINSKTEFNIINDSIKTFYTKYLYECTGEIKIVKLDKKKN